MRKITLLIALFFNVIAFSQTFTVEGIEYGVTSSSDLFTVKIFGYTGVNADVIIPNTVENSEIIYNVTSIGEAAFYGENLTSVIISDNVTSIESGAFENNSNLETVVIGNGVTDIGTLAFASGNEEEPDLKGKLNNVVFGSSVKNIGDYAFLNNSLTNVVLPEGLEYIGDEVFYNNELTSVTIPNSVVHFGINTFGVNRLTNLFIPEGLLSISEGLFNYNELTNVVISEGVTSIGNGAFIGNKLTSISIPSSVDNIDAYVFLNNPLETVISKSENPASLPIFAFGFFDDNEILVGDTDSAVTLSRNQIDLIIPVGATAAYEAAGWIGFKSVTEDDDLSVNNVALSKEIEILLDYNSKLIQISTASDIVIESLSVFTASGIQVLKDDVSTLSTASLSNGVYVLKMETNKGMVTKKFVK